MVKGNLRQFPAKVGIRNNTGGKGQPQPQQQQQIRVRPEETSPVLCPNCGGEVFFSGSLLRNLPALLSPAGKVTTIAVGIGWFCLNCHQQMIQDPNNQHEIIPAPESPESVPQEEEDVRPDGGSE
jgi:hypothetical protein